MELPAWYSMTPEQKINEPGTEPDCPFCQHPRVLRSDYIRCNPCGINWLAEEMHLPDYLNRNPSAARSNPNGKPQASALTASSTSTTADQLEEDADEDEVITE